MKLIMSDKHLATIIFTACLLSFFASNALAHHCRYYKPDPRNLCLAKNEDKRFYCSYIKDPDQQRYCYSFMDKAPGRCEEIGDETLKEQCKVEAQARLDEALALQKAAKEAAEAAKAAEEAEEAAKEAAKQATKQRQSPAAKRR